MTSIPKPKRNGRKTSKYGFEKLKKYGDSVCYAVPQGQEVKYRAVAHTYAAYNNFKVETRLENGVLTVYHAGDAVR